MTETRRPLASLQAVFAPGFRHLSLALVFSLGKTTPIRWRFYQGSPRNVAAELNLVRQADTFNQSHSKRQGESMEQKTRVVGGGGGSQCIFPGETLPKLNHSAIQHTTRNQAGKQHCLHNLIDFIIPGPLAPPHPQGKNRNNPVPAFIPRLPHLQSRCALKWPLHPGISPGKSPRSFHPSHPFPAKSPRAGIHRVRCRGRPEMSRP